MPSLPPDSAAARGQALLALHFPESLGDVTLLVAPAADADPDSLRAGSKEGVARAVGATGGTITSCGLVMAAAFLLLARNPILLVQQIGVAVVRGVLLDTVVVRGMLVSALAALARTGARRTPGAPPEQAYDPAG